MLIVRSVYILHVMIAFVACMCAPRKLQGELRNGTIYQTPFKFAAEMNKLNYLCNRCQLFNFSYRGLAESKNCTI